MIWAGITLTTATILLCLAAASFSAYLAITTGWWAHWMLLVAQAVLIVVNVKVLCQYRRMML